MVEAPSSRREGRSAAELALMATWAVLAAGLLGWAMARAGVGAAVLAGFPLWMLCSAWTAGPGTVRDRRGL